MFSKLNRDIAIVILVMSIVTILLGTYEAYAINQQKEARLASYRQLLFADYDDSIKKQVQTVINQIHAYYERAQKGLMTEEEAKKLALNVVRDARYGEDKSGVFWADSFDGVLLSSGAGNAVIGKVRTGAKDAKGNLFVQTFIENAKQAEGGFSEYYYPRPKDVDPTQTPLPKRSYSAGFTPWQWSIGTGNYVDDLEAMVQVYQKQLDEEQINQLTYSISTYLFILILAMLTSLFLNSKITKRIRPMAQVAQKVTAGNLSVERIDSGAQDSIGDLAQAFNEMVQNLSSVVKQTKSYAGQVAQTAEQLQAGMEQSAHASDLIVTSIGSVDNGTGRQLTLVKDAAAAVLKTSEAMTTMMTNSQEMVDQSGEVVKAAQVGEQNIDRTIQQMAQIEHTVMDSGTVVKNLGERSKQISIMAETISKIASQTNLLALNAAIEAARAGEHGKGFAVVADEVRLLAEQSNEASKQITELIQDIHIDAGKAIEAMDVGAKEVKTGTAVVQEAGASFKKISLLITQMLTEIHHTIAQMKNTAEVSQSAEKAVQEVEAISRDISLETTQISSAIDEQSASLEEITASSAVLTDMAEELNRWVDKFKI
ncbi:methyl-accepting chemotaxis protein [Anaerosinus massiliensis]|uniref:methyl-accepting chemotaxis protein n=1 Tax=Massilibacillus massiliensis TaxID=1806837 RepID=UPI0018FEFEA8|nr:methyl-accepting chemotaxis protein [Massilibacillus massiliensis]